MKKLGLLRFGDIDFRVLDYLKLHLPSFFSNLIEEVQIMKEIEEVPKDAFYESRNQYLVRLFKAKMDVIAERLNYYRILGITNVDIFKRGSSFVFGIAELTDRDIENSVCIISLARLDPRFYGIQTLDEDLFKIYLLRILKEAIHELGHTFGLVHCNENNCVMKFSKSFEDIDLKPASFCFNCLEKLKSS